MIAAGMICASAFVHPGRTDSRGGHHDKKNASGLGAYHYHCGGCPAHLHDDSICPYSKPQKMSGGNESSGGMDSRSGSSSSK